MARIRPSFAIGFLVSAAVFALAGCLASAQSPAQASAIRVPPWKDVSGKSYDAGAVSRGKATVFFFSSTQCPISNIYTPRMIELAGTYQPKGVGFFLVNSNREDSLSTVRRYAAERKFPFPAVKDKGTALADALNADKTPEAVILDAQGVVRYRGRIDDNQDRTKIIRHDAADALDALLAGKPVPRPKTLAFGCSIFRDAVRTAAASRAAVTYAHDIAPILNANCVSCHRQGEAAPFALGTYQQAKTWAVAIKDYTGRRLMPPWKAAPGYGDFKDAHTLTDAQIAAIAKWASSGATPGDLKKAPPTPTFERADAWQLGAPDLILRPTAPYKLAAEGQDVYRNYVLPIDFDQDKYVSAIELKPGNRTIVHHMIAYLDVAGTTAAMEGKDGQPGYTVPGVGIGVSNFAFLQGWAPGNTPPILPPGTAFKLDKGAKLVLQVHYHKDGKEELDQSRIGIHFANGTVSHVMRVWAVQNSWFDLKPDVANQKVEGMFMLPLGVHVWSVSPHMHMLGREMKMTAILPDKTEKEMVWIKDWDFNWQENYRYKEPLVLPAGTRVKMTAVFDNTTSNPRQPTHPPKEVRFGEQTTDEMCIGFFSVTIDRENLNLNLNSQTATQK